jgi:hypothetical protein
MDLRAYHYKVVEGLLASGHDQAISVSLVTATTAWTTDVFSRIYTSLAKSMGQPTTQKVTAALLSQFPVLLRPLDPLTKSRALDQPTYPCRFLSQRSDQNADFEAALEILVADMVDQVPGYFPVGPNLWGEPFATAPETKNSGHSGGI